MADEVGPSPLLTSLLGRRALLRGGAATATGLAAAALIGCGGDDEAPPSDAAAELTTTDKRPERLPPGWVWDANAPFPVDFRSRTSRRRPEASSTSRRRGMSGRTTRLQPRPAAPSPC